MIKLAYLSQLYYYTLFGTFPNKEGRRNGTLTFKNFKFYINLLDHILQLSIYISFDKSNNVILQELKEEHHIFGIVCAQIIFKFMHTSRGSIHF